MKNMFGEVKNEWDHIGHLSGLVKRVRLTMHHLGVPPFVAAALDRTDNTISLYWARPDVQPLSPTATLSEIYRHEGTLHFRISIPEFIQQANTGVQDFVAYVSGVLMKSGFKMGVKFGAYEAIEGETEYAFPIGVNTYESMAERVAENGVRRGNRTGTDTFGVFSENMVFDLRDGFPLVTTKSVHFKSILVELLWFLRGSDNIAWLKENGVSIWDEWAKEDGSLGPVYGVQWRNWTAMKKNPLVVEEDANCSIGELVTIKVDQIAELIEKLKTNPFDRRLIVSAWNVGQISEMALPPCHAFFQFYVEEQDVKILHCKLYQRSADVFLGVPFNIASYALLMTIIARQVGMLPGRFHWTGGDVHIYENHADKIGMQLQRLPLKQPQLKITREGIPDDVAHYEVSDFKIENYNHHPAIKAAVAV